MNRPPYEKSPGSGAVRDGEAHRGRHRLRAAGLPDDRRRLRRQLHGGAGRADARRARHRRRGRPYPVGIRADLLDRAAPGADQGAAGRWVEAFSSIGRGRGSFQATGGRPGIHAGTVQHGSRTALRSVRDDSFWSGQGWSRKRGCIAAAPFVFSPAAKRLRSPGLSGAAAPSASASRLRHRRRCARPRRPSRWHRC